MKIIRHHFHNNELQRSEVENNTSKYVRVHQLFSCINGDLRPVEEDEPRWFLYEGGVFVKCHREAQVEFEQHFINELIRANEPAPAPPPPLLEPAPAPIQLPAEADDVPF